MPDLPEPEVREPMIPSKGYTLPAPPVTPIEPAPTMGALWTQADGDRDRYRELLLKHGYIIDCETEAPRPATPPTIKTPR